MLAVMTVDGADSPALLHLCTPAERTSYELVGEIAPASLDEVGFVHLSTPDQVALPAQRLFPGRTDLVLLVLSPSAIADAGIEVRWEPGVPGAPEAMRFPHAYGAVPASAVRAVVPYPPGPDGFTAPEIP
ncbi:glutathione S-transferase [Pseudonocardia sp. EC080610-09]|nr:glutathione S-transferase [Pseudonocardia sp. EC080610-09]ALL82325.1 glutathione S-transferase [Pseudonocardia sp. EC080619-01]